MKRLCSLLFLLLSCMVRAQHPLAGRITEQGSDVAVEGASIQLLPSGHSTTTDAEGFFHFREIKNEQRLIIQASGYETESLSLEEFIHAAKIARLKPVATQLSTIILTAGAGQPYRAIGRLDIKTRNINNSQEVLRLVPGLFIGQHAGGGKAEQIFLRGFDLDHGTDIQISADGVPVNMVSHAHGQGYADLHFIIPETIDNVNFKKGSYDASKGNFTTTGFVDFNTFHSLPRNSIKVEAGMYQSLRTVGLFNLLGQKAAAGGKSAYLASEYMYTKGFFDHPQNFNRYNIFGKYTGRLGQHHQIVLSASGFSSRWNASGQIPDRAVANGLVGFYGAIDPNEGGHTKRMNVNAGLTTRLDNGSFFRNQLYYTRYAFTLFSNFTFYKEDPVNGDQVKQQEKRDLFGYNGSYHKTSYAGHVQLTTEAGMNLRMDRTKGSGLERTKDRDSVTATLKLGNIRENNAGFYVSETILLHPRFSIHAGIRYDLFQSTYEDKLTNTAGTAGAAVCSPKLSFFYHVNDRLQFYLSNGKGFHSNDTRVVVAQKGVAVLPSSYGSDLGAVIRPNKNILLHLAAWYLWMDQEFIYVGDEGVIEPSGKSRRYGADLSIRYQPLRWLYADADLNYAHPRSIGSARGHDFLPLAPKLTSTGGLSVQTGTGLTASCRYRYMSDRPANEDGSVVAKGYCIADASIQYQRKKYELGLAIQNLFNSKWKETQFDTESRLQSEPAPVSEIHFTPGTPFSARLSFALLF